MKAADRIKAEESLFRLWAGNSEESAAIAILARLCRESPELRHWVWEDFGRNAKVRAKFAEAVKTPADPSVRTFAELTGDGGPLREEARRLREQFTTRIYGGLTWNEIIGLIRHYQAGSLDLGAFVLAQDWRSAGKPSPLLMLTGIEFLGLVIPTGRRRLLKNLDRALGLLRRGESPAKRRAAFGYSDWWKLQALFHIVGHPKPAYSIRELRARLAGLGLKPTAKDVRRFCTRHGIRRDMRAGRPRTRTAARIAAR